MSLPRDDHPFLSPLTDTLRQEFLSRPKNVALVVIRRHGCGCALGSVYRLPSGDLLIGRRRAMVQRSRTAAEARQQQVYIALDDVEEIVLVSEIACRHQKALPLPLGEVRAAVGAAAAGQRRIGAPLTL